MGRNVLTPATRLATLLSRLVLDFEVFNEQLISKTILPTKQSNPAKSLPKRVLSSKDLEVQVFPKIQRVPQVTNITFRCVCFSRIKT